MHIICDCLHHRAANTAAPKRMETVNYGVKNQRPYHPWEKTYLVGARKKMHLHCRKLCFSKAQEEVEEEGEEEAEEVTAACVWCPYRVETHNKPPWFWG